MEYLEPEARRTKVGRKWLNYLVNKKSTYREDSLWREETPEKVQSKGDVMNVLLRNIKELEIRNEELDQQVRALQADRRIPVYTH